MQRYYKLGYNTCCSNYYIMQRYHKSGYNKVITNFRHYELTSTGLKDLALNSNKVGFF